MFCPQCGEIVAPGPLNPRCLLDGEAEPVGDNSGRPRRLVFGLTTLRIIGGFVARHRLNRRA